MTQSSLIARIKADPQAQPRAQLDQELIAEYAEAMQAGAEFPPVVVFEDGEASCWLADGFHRLEATRQVGKKEITAEVRRGDRRAAILFSAGANATHGCRRSNNDKRRAVTKLLEDPEWAEWSDIRIAEAAKVSPPFVATVREELSPNGLEMQPPVGPAAMTVLQGGKPKPKERRKRKVTRGGKTYFQDTTNIGQRGGHAPPPAAADPPPPHQPAEEQVPGPSTAEEATHEAPGVAESKAPARDDRVEVILGRQQRRDALIEKTGIDGLIRFIRSIQGNVDLMVNEALVDGDLLDAQYVIGKVESRVKTALKYDLSFAAAKALIKNRRAKLRKAPAADEEPGHLVGRNSTGIPPEEGEVDDSDGEESKE